MGELDTYTVIDFMPVEPEVYFRLFVRQNEGMWPAQLLTVGLVVAALIMAWRGASRPVGVILGTIWAWVGYSFFIDMYAELNWAAEYFGWAFMLQGSLLTGYGIVGRLDFVAPDGGDTPGRAAWGLAAVGVVAYPFLIPITGRDWAGIEVFGAAPDPTALVTLAMVVFARQIRWELMVVPVVWCAYSGLTSVAMEWPMGAVSTVLALLACGLAVWRRLASSPAHHDE